MDSWDRGEFSWQGRMLEMQWLNRDDSERVADELFGEYENPEQL